jgi:hypothetical protein
MTTQAARGQAYGARPWRPAALAVGGFGLGILLTRSDPLGDHSARPAPPEAAAIATERRPVDRTGDDGRITALERRLHDVETQRRTDTTDERSDHADREEITPEREKELRERREAEWAAKLDHHAHQPVDRAWSTEAQASIAADMGSVASAAGFKLQDVSCKTTTCTAEIEWATREEAVKNYSKLLHVNYQRNCGREILLPDGAPAGAYRATVLFDCADVRGKSR